MSVPRSGFDATADSAAKPLVTICGLGPGSADLVTTQTVEQLKSAEIVFLRTSKHPSAEVASGAVSFDDVYERAESFANVYDEIADRVVSSAVAVGEVTYCVPGSPLILERSVQHLRSRPEINVRLLPAVSFLDEVWARLQVDPVDDGVRLIDGHRFAVETAGERGPLLVAHVHAQWVLADIKLALAASPELDEDLTAIVLQRVGTPEEKVFQVSWDDLDRAVEADHLTSLYFPRFEAPLGSALSGSVELMRRLREDCPWDRSQSHGSLRRSLIEEAYEVLDVLDRVVELEARASDDSDRSGSDDMSQVEVVAAELIDAYADLESELGDLLFQILFHARLAAESGQFDISDVAQTLIDKMVGRHPHVFGTDTPTLFTSPPPDAQFEAHDENQWEQLKNKESRRQSVLDGIPRSMPSLARSLKVLKRVSNRFGPPTFAPRFQQTAKGPSTTEDLGSLLLAIVEQARGAGLDPEFALRSAIDDLENLVRDQEAAGKETLNWILG